MDIHAFHYLIIPNGTTMGHKRDKSPTKRYYFFKMRCLPTNNPDKTATVLSKRNAHSIRASSSPVFGDSSVTDPFSDWFGSSDCSGFSNSVGFCEEPCCVFPLSFLGILTVITQITVFPSAVVPVIAQVPFPTAVTFPFPSTVAILGLPDT